MLTRRATALGLLFSPALVQSARSQTAAAGHQLSTVFKGLEYPWSLAFLPDGRMLVTERPGRLRLLSPAGQPEVSISGVPAVFYRGQGGLLDVALAPDFGSSRRLYLSLAEPRDGGAATTVISARLSQNNRSLTDQTVIFRQLPASQGSMHFGSRIVPSRDGMLFIALGERGQKEKSQDLSTHYGKVVRIGPDGAIPSDNPFVGRAPALPEIFSYGHRNIQAAALHPTTGRLWTIEHGARGGDEINIPQAGKNYGWPVITYGRDYSGLRIGEGTHKEGMEQPIFYWDPSIAPSGMAFYTGDLFPAWKGNLFVGALAGSLVSRLILEGDKVVREERLLSGLGYRFRDVRQGPDGALYMLTDDRSGELLRLSPKAV